MTFTLDEAQSTSAEPVALFADPQNYWVHAIIERARSNAAWQPFARRALDILVAGAVSIILLPLLLGVALCVKLTSRGPALFVQQRLGKDALPFLVLKFRTMTVNADENYHRERSLAHMRERTLRGGLFKNESDPRVTSLGRFLRKTSIDELPQLFNVLRGEMSLVGPRPCLAYEYEMYEPRHRERVRVRPGLTGLMQVCGRASLTFDEMIELDLLYAANPSLELDVAILMRTPMAILRGTGAC